MIKTNGKDISLWLVLLTAGGFFTACGSDIDTVSDPNAIHTYELTIEGSKGDDGVQQAAMSRRVLTDDNNGTITSTWNEGDEVSVYNKTKGKAMSGKLKAQSANQNAVLKGTLTGEVAIGDKLILSYGSKNYNTQDGTLTGISTNCDYAEAEVTVTGIVSNEIEVENGGAAVFSNSQSIVKFKLLVSENNPLGNVSQLKIIAGSDTYIITPSSPTNGPLYAALCPFTSTRVSLIATVGDKDYKYTKNSISFEKGKLYRINVKPSLLKKAADAVADDKNKIIGADGHIYDSKEEAGYYGTKACATIVYVGLAGSVASNTTYKGLAIALTDETGSAVDKWGNTKEEVDIANHETMSSALNDLAGISNTAELVKEYGTKDGYIGKAINQFRTSTPHPAGTSDWFIPSLGQWALLLNADGAKITSESSWNDPFITTTSSDMTSTPYSFSINHIFWTSTECGIESAAYLSYGSEKKVTIGPYTKGGTIGDSPALRPFLAF